MSGPAGALAAPAAGVPRTRPGVTARALVIALFGLYACDNLLTPAFLGAPVAPMLAMGALASALIAWLLARAGGLSVRIPASHLAVGLTIALALLVLGGEGRLFYANPDWQVRDAVLADMARYPWPYAYDLAGWTAILRAPLGMYLLPALAGWTDSALLLSNGLRLGILLALAAQLFPGRRQRAIALAVFIAFSGMDAVGNALVGWLGSPVAWDHLEQWNPGSQYSSTVTLAFWVPNHAIAGWTCALCYLLWLRRLAPVGLLGAAVPMVAVWSPLAAIGALPFALHAAFVALRTGEWNRHDAALALLATAIALPALWFMRLDAGAVGGGWQPIALVPFVMLLAFEVAPLWWPVRQFKRLRPGERAMLWLILLCLLFMPMVRIGVGIDFQMRASIVPLALLTFAFAEWVNDLSGGAGPRPLLMAAGLILALGAVTPLMEIRRALVHEPSPPPRCSLYGAWQAQSNAIPPYGTYFAGADALPAWLARPPIVAGRDEPARCWARQWAPIDRP